MLREQSPARTLPASVPTYRSTATTVMQTGGSKPGFQGQVTPPPTWVQVSFYLSVMVMAGIIAVREYRAKRSLKLEFWLATLIALVCALLVFNVAYANGVARKVAVVLGLHVTQGLAVLMVVCFGWAAHRFKRRSKFYYGCVEVTFGVASAIVVVSTVNFAAIEFSQISLAQIVAVVASGYVVARGLNNCYDAKNPNSRIE